MKTLKIYDPAMCCSSGVCGPDVDPVLVQLSNFLKNLDASAVQVERYNLSQEPAAYTTGIVSQLLRDKGVGVLPLVIVDDDVISEGTYPDLNELAAKLGVISIASEPASGCCGGGSCC